VKRGTASIAIVLSGTGSDGTRGSKAIVDAGGSVLVQDPNTTRFNGMPTSMTSQGTYSLIASPPSLANAVSHLLKGRPLESLESQTQTTGDRPIFQIFSMLEQEFGIDITQYSED